MIALLVNAKLFPTMPRTKDFDENEVLAKAVRLFWHKGYNGTSMEDLVDFLDISRSSLYRAFTDKHTLFKKALYSYQQFSFAQVREVIDDTVTAKKNIRNLMEFIAGQMLRDKQQKGCFSVNTEVELAPHDREIKQMVILNDRQTEDLFYKVVKKGQETGEIKKDPDARMRARFIFNAVQGMRVTVKSTSDKTIFDGIIKLTLSSLD